MAVVAHFR